VGRRRHDRSQQRIGIVSAVPEEGKTTVTLGLATALAQVANCRVLILEADLRNPTLEKYLGVARCKGVSEWLYGDETAPPIRLIAPPGFHVLTAGMRPLENPSLLGSDRMGALLETVQRAFDFVLVDCTPLATVADAVALQEFVDAFVLVVRANHAPREALQRAVVRLPPASVIGTVVTDSRQITRSRYYGSPRYRQPQAYEA
jgi:capsular exopolysaccharide synthesis family protein